MQSNLNMKGRQTSSTVQKYIPSYPLTCCWGHRVSDFPLPAASFFLSYATKKRGDWELTLAMSSCACACASRWRAYWETNNCEGLEENHPMLEPEQKERCTAYVQQRRGQGSPRAGYLYPRKVPRSAQSLRTSTQSLRSSGHQVTLSCPWTSGQQAVWPAHGPCFALNFLPFLNSVTDGGKEPETYTDTWGC